MMRITKKAQHLSLNIAAFCTAFALTTLPGSVLAQERLGAVARRVTVDIFDFKNLLLVVCTLLGVVFLVMSLWLLNKDSKIKNQGYAGQALIAFIVGVGLLVLPWLGGSGAATLTGDGNEARNAIINNSQTY